MNIKAQKQFEEDLNKSETLSEILDTLQRYYNTEECKCGPSLKTMLRVNMSKLLFTTRCQPRKEFK